MKVVPLVLMMVFATASRVHAQRLDDFVEIVAFAWQHADTRTLVAMAAREGIVIETRDGRMGPLASRQASAVLRRLFGERETISIRPNMAQMVGGTPRRAFGEIIWITRAPDTTESERLTVYFELVLEGDRWRIAQIRMLP